MTEIFPKISSEEYRSMADGSIQNRVISTEGASRRDLFAAFAMQSLIITDPKATAGSVAEEAVVYAEALLDALEE